MEACLSRVTPRGGDYASTGNVVAAPHQPYQASLSSSWCHADWGPSGFEHFAAKKPEPPGERTCCAHGSAGFSRNG
jgi:hypothetical protein